MDTDAKGQLGGIECSRDARERMAKESGAWTCPACGKQNTEIMKEREEMVREIEATEGKRKEEEIPEELRLAYRDELGKKDDTPESSDKGKEKAAEAPTSPASAPAPTPAPAAPQPAPAAVSRPRSTPTTRPRPAPQIVRTSSDRSLAWIDTCIYGLVAALLFMVLKRYV